MSTNHFPYVKTAAEGCAARHAQTTFSQATLSLQTWCRKISVAILERHNQVAEDIPPEVALAWDYLGSLPETESSSPTISRAA